MQAVGPRPPVASTTSFHRYSLRVLAQHLVEAYASTYFYYLSGSVADPDNNSVGSNGVVDSSRRSGGGPCGPQPFVWRLGE